MQAVEIEFLIVWHNPSIRPELQIVGEDTLTVWKNRNKTDKQWQDYTRLAWDISPALAVYLPDRYYFNHTISLSINFYVNISD